MTRQEVSIVSPGRRHDDRSGRKDGDACRSGRCFGSTRPASTIAERSARSVCKRPGRFWIEPTWPFSWSTPDVGEEFEEGIFHELHERKIPIIVALNKVDVAPSPAELIERFEAEKVPFIEAVASEGRGAAELREAILRTAPDDFLRPPPIIADLVPPGEMAVLVTPIDLEAPKGRLILPQVQTIRDLLDGDAFCIVVKEHQLAEALGRLNRPPTLVVTDSQAFDQVAATTPLSVMLTSFSILMARQKGDLRQFVEGALAIERLRPGDRVLVAEACTHHTPSATTSAG